MATGKHRVYFALRPDPAAAEAALRLAEEMRGRHGLAGAPIPAERLHVSLNWLADRPSGQVIDKARAAVAGVAQPSFRVAFNRVATFAGGAVVLYGDDGVIGIERLHAAIHAALAAPGIALGPPRAFEPHMTLLRDRRAVPAGWVEPVSWQVRDFVLIHSGEGRHEALGRWSLAG